MLATSSATRCGCSECSLLSSYGAGGEEQCSILVAAFSIGGRFNSAKWWATVGKSNGKILATALSESPTLMRPLGVSRMNNDGLEHVVTLVREPGTPQREASTR